MTAAVVARVAVPPLPARAKSNRSSQLQLLTFRTAPAGFAARRTLSRLTDLTGSLPAGAVWSSGVLWVRFPQKAARPPQFYRFASCKLHQGNLCPGAGAPNCGPGRPELALRCCCSAGSSFKQKSDRPVPVRRAISFYMDAEEKPSGPRRLFLRHSTGSAPAAASTASCSASSSGGAAVSCTSCTPKPAAAASSSSVRGAAVWAAGCRAVTSPPGRDSR